MFPIFPILIYTISFLKKSTKPLESFSFFFLWVSGPKKSPQPHIIEWPIFQPWP